MKNNQFVALIKYICPFCGQVDEKQSSLAIHKKFGDLSSIDNQPVGFGKLCEDCDNTIGDNLGIVEVKDGEIGNNPYRTGRTFVFTKEFKDNNNIDSRIIYVEESLLKDIQ